MTVQEKIDTYVDAHLGFTPGGKNHLVKYHSALCGSCTTGINFRICLYEFERFEKLLMNSDEAPEKQPKPQVVYSDPTLTPVKP